MLCWRTVTKPGYIDLPWEGPHVNDSLIWAIRKRHTDGWWRSLLPKWASACFSSKVPPLRCLRHCGPWTDSTWLTRHLVKAALCSFMCTWVPWAVIPFWVMKGFPFIVVSNCPHSKRDPSQQEVNQSRQVQFRCLSAFLVSGTNWVIIDIQLTCNTLQVFDVNHSDLIFIYIMKSSPQ